MQEHIHNPFPIQSPPERKPTLRDIMEQHHISIGALYVEMKREVASQDIHVFVTNSVGFDEPMKKILERVNQLAGTHYSLEDIHTNHIYHLATSEKESTPDAANE